MSRTHLFFFMAACLVSTLCMEVGKDHNDSPPLLCILVPFRDGCGWQGKGRTAQLDHFVHNMTAWLQARGHNNFRFVVAEQSQKGLFNKGILFNLGALKAFSMGCEHLVFHDVDQLPTHPQNDYRYTGEPLHMCVWTTQNRPKSLTQPHVGGAVMMSRYDYVQVNGFSNRYWRWGLEDNDMYHRIYTIFNKLSRLNVMVGAYQDLPHERVEMDNIKAEPQFWASCEVMEGIHHQDEEARKQLKSDGLAQVCRYTELIHSSEDAARRMTTVVGDLFPAHASQCSDAEPNFIKLDMEERWRRDASRLRGSCAAFLKEAGLLPNRNVVLERRICTSNADFCINAFTSEEIRENTARLDAIPRAPASIPERPSHQPVGTAPFDMWAEVLTARMKVELARQPPHHPVSHEPDEAVLMMGWNESMAYLRSLARQRVPFAVTRYGPAERSVLSRKPYTTSTWSWDTQGVHADWFRDLLAQPFRDALGPGSRMMLAMPVSFCAEAFEANNDRVGGGGRLEDLREYWRPELAEELGLRAIKPHRFLYSWQFGNLNYNATLGLIQTLRDASWPIVVVCKEDHVEHAAAPAWADAVLTVAERDARNLIQELDFVLATFETLAAHVHATAFVFAIADFGTPVISAMHRANAQNVYLDVGAALDLEISGERSQDFHPTRKDPSHFVRAGGALEQEQACTETRWEVADTGFVPAH
mmetsp:Transcript_10124/g.23656  ORF Transcript_10124/g.23656 Transcript_10124/m.23656 type:complete len:701 (-) Transcript_10124:159-2261(-)